jgi:hypothetical protein
VIAKYAKAPDLISGAFQPEHKQLTGLDRTKIHLTRPPKIHFLEIRLRREKVEPSIVSVGDEQVHHERLNSEILGEELLMTFIMKYPAQHEARALNSRF